MDLKANRCCRNLHYLLVLVLDIADLVSDWMMYAEVKLAEKGLVYGPVEEPIVTAMLVFCIIGTCTFIIEEFNLLSLFCRGEKGPFFDLDTVSAITIWIEDVPQIAINVRIAWCREDSISVFQLSKACIALISLFLQLFILLGTYCYEKRRWKKKHEGKKPYADTCSKVVFGFIIAGLIINSACAIAVFVFTQTWRHPGTGEPVFQVPKTVFGDTYDDQRYFQNVSVFVHHPDFDSAPIQSTANGNSKQVNWVRLMSINDVRGSDVQVNYNYVYEKSKTQLRMALWKRTVASTDKAGGGSWELRECSDMNLTDGSLTMVNKTICKDDTYFTNSTNVYIGFSFTKPGVVINIIKKSIFGDIGYNIMVGSDGRCVDYANITDSVEHKYATPIIHYYRANATLSATDTHLLLVNGKPRFFRNDGSDLEDVKDLWRTGWGGCDSSGSMGPTLQRDIPTACGDQA